jgi:4-amino-4-deoxy-L-arabinose transferase-like glycosyltransferase
LDTVSPYILAAILGVAFVFRLYKLDVGLWLDEILTYVKYVNKPFGQIVATYDSQNQHLLYSLLARASFWIFGEGAWSLRLPAVIFGVGSIWTLYLLGRKVASTREALFGAGLFTFSYHHIWFSQNARGYTGLLFWTLLSSWLLLRGLHEGQPRFWLAYAVAASLGVYTHITMLFVIIGHFIIYLFKLVAWRKTTWANKWAGFVLGFCLAGVLTVLLYAPVLPEMIRTTVGAEREGTAVREWANPLWTLLEFARGMKLSFAGSLIAVAATFVFGIGLWSLARETPVVVQFLLIPSSLGGAIMIGTGHHLWPRFFFFAFGFAALVVVRGARVLGHLVAQLPGLSSFKPIWLGDALCIGLVLVSAVSVPFAYGPKQDYEGALEFIETKKEPGDAVVTVGLATFPYQFYYKVDWKEAETLEALNIIRSQARRTWLLYTLPVQLKSLYPEITATIQSDFKVMRSFYGTLGDGTIFVCRSDEPPSESLIVGRSAASWAGRRESYD